MTPTEDHNARIRGTALGHLRYHWGDWFTITWRDGLYHASRIDNPAEAFSAVTPEELNELMRDNYLSRPVPAAYLP
jgi:hypothetical protein